MSEAILSSDLESTALAKRMFDLRTQKDRLKSQLDNLSAELDQVKEALTKKMVDLEIQKFSLDGLGTYYLSTSIYPKILDNGRMIEWLDEHNRSDIAPRTVQKPALKEFVEEAMEKDAPVPGADLLEMNSITDVRLRISKKGE